MRALVIEDGSKMAALLRRGLQEEGFAVDVAANGEDGSWLGAENDYDVILLDVMLPDIDGFEVCRRLRAADRWAGHRVGRPFHLVHGPLEGERLSLGIRMAALRD